ncbi:MAG: hypothetical protein LBH93_08750 [Chitinispirillales bacterium]|jgi:hypothetical protein|nr:hypothetical protein [Chitinispirillales bacterium]
MAKTTLTEICGCIHLHTTFSDGGCGYGAIIAAAGGAGLDYICVTDHMTLEGKRAGFDGPRDGGIFVLVGYEHNDNDNRNHYLAFGVNKTAEDSTDPQKYINRVKQLGGIGFLAHPAEKRNYIADLPPYPWTRWDATGFDGIEIWNQISDWMEQLRGWHSFTKLFRPNRSIGGAPTELLRKWDAMNGERFVSAIGGVDAHSRKFKKGPFSYVIFPINVELRGIRTHLFVDKSEWGDKSKMSGALISAMRDGRGFMSNFSRGDARGCKMFLRDETGAIQYPGRQTPPYAAPSFPITMNVELTRKAKITLVRNGKPIQSQKAKSASWTIVDKGVYRIEAHRGRKAWIYSNPFPIGGYPFTTLNDEQ